MSTHIALARVEMFETDFSHPHEYKKETMWKDLQVLADEVNSLRNENRTLRKNLQRFAPGTPTVEEYDRANNTIPNGSKLASKGGGRSIRSLCGSAFVASSD